MGVFSFIKSIVSAEAMGDEIINVQMHNYNRVIKALPDRDQHEWLAQTWLMRMKARGKDIGTEEMQFLAMTETMQFACLPYPKNIRALGLFFVYKEHPEIIREFEKFGAEYTQLMGPIINGEIDVEEEYQKYNPNSQL